MNPATKPANAKSPNFRKKRIDCAVEESEARFGSAITIGDHSHVNRDAYGSLLPMFGLGSFDPSHRKRGNTLSNRYVASAERTGDDRKCPGFDSQEGGVNQKGGKLPSRGKLADTIGKEEDLKSDRQRGEEDPRPGRPAASAQSQSAQDERRHHDGPGRGPQREEEKAE